MATKSWRAAGNGRFFDCCNKRRILDRQLQRAGAPLAGSSRGKFPKISPLLNAYDVVLIQECFVRHDLLSAQANFPNKAYFGRPAPGKGVNSGLSVLTRLPMGK